MSSKLSLRDMFRLQSTQHEYDLAYERTPGRRSGLSSFLKSAWNGVTGNNGAEVFEHTEHNSERGRNARGRLVKMADSLDIQAFRSSQSASGRMRRRNVLQEGGVKVSEILMKFGVKMTKVGIIGRNIPVISRLRSPTSARSEEGAILGLSTGHTSLKPYRTTPWDTIPARPPAIIRKP